jgi:hypothetical protein
MDGWYFFERIRRARKSIPPNSRAPIAKLGAKARVEGKRKTPQEPLARRVLRRFLEAASPDCAQLSD